MSTHTPLRRRARRDNTDKLLDRAAILALVASLLLIVAALMLVTRDLNGTEAAQAPEPDLREVTPITNVSSSGSATPIANEPSIFDMTASATPTMTIMPTSTLINIPTTSPQGATVAIVAGHRNSDSGAICEIPPYQGLQEVHITTNVTTELVALLTEKGYRVLDLDEFDDRIMGLKADAFISIHADSCVNWEGTTGYKAARAYNSAIPEIEDRFIACIEQEYGVTTGLPHHPHSVTHNMTSYHAFAKVDFYTPAIIMEIGFLYYDYDLLTERPDLVAEGLKRGIECFLSGKEIVVE